VFEILFLEIMTVFTFFLDIFGPV